MTAPMSPERRAAIERRIAHWEECGSTDVPLPIRTARAMLAEIDRLNAELARRNGDDPLL